jgi:flagellar hook-length control protein FliK
MEAGRNVLSVNGTAAAKETTLPGEEQSEPDQMPESHVVTTSSIKESLMTGSFENKLSLQPDPRAVEIVEQVIHRLNGRIKSGPTSMHVQLNPETLGEIEVEVIRDAQGVSVTFFAEQTNTGKLLETQLGQLRQSLVESGVQLAGLNIGQHRHSRQEGGFQHQRTNFAHHPQNEAFQTGSTPEAGPRPERGGGRVSEIDYRI